MLNDLLFSLRMLRKSPVFTLAAILTLTLGIGANTAIFSISYQVLDDLPYPDPDRLVRLFSTHLERGTQFDPSLPDLLDIRDRMSSLEALEAYRNRRMSLDGDEGQRAYAVTASPGFLALLGAKPHQGRLLGEADWAADAPRAAVLSFEFWVSRYGGSEDAVGQSVQLGDHAYTIVGVAKPVLGPALRRHDIFLPWRMEDQRDSARRGSRGGIETFAKLSAGGSLAQAQAELDVIGQELARQHPDSSNGFKHELVNFLDKEVGGVRPTLLALTGASLLILLIAVANIANLMLARGNRRRSEIAIRSALGAGKMRLARLLLSESIVLSLLGGAAGLAGAWFLIEAFVANSPIRVPRLEEVAVDAQVILTALGVSLLSGLVFGLAPLFSISREAASDAIESAGRQGEGASSRGQAGLAVVQLALSLILLTGSGLMVRSFLALQAVPLGIDYRQVLVLSASGMMVGNFSNRPQRLQRFHQIAEEIEALPGVEAVALTSQAPLTGGWGSDDVEILTGSRSGSTVAPELIGVSGSFFEFFDSRAVEGRLFGPQDTDFADSLVVVDAKLAEKLWPEQSAVGQRVSFRDTEAEVIGVVEPIRYGDLAEDVRPKLYTLQEHSSSAFGGKFLIRHRGEAETVMGTLRSRLEENHPSLPIHDLRPLQAYYEEWLVRPRFFLLLLSGLGLLALLVAAVGVYGVMSYAVNRRRREIGIRMALGARRTNIFKLFYQRTATQLAFGLTLGLLGALGLTRYLESLLFQVEPTDPLALAGTALVLTVTAGAAVLLPVRRAVLVNPSETLKDEG